MESIGWRNWNRIVTNFDNFAFTSEIFAKYMSTYSRNSGWNVRLRERMKYHPGIIFCARSIYGYVVYIQLLYKFNSKKNVRIIYKIPIKLAKEVANQINGARSMTFLSEDRFKRREESGRFKFQTPSCRLK